jgi:trigger factor
MAFKVEKIENCTATIKIDVSPEDFEKSIAKAYAKNKDKFKIDGFRKGKVPRQMIEARYGKGVFYEDAIDEAFPDEYLNIIESGELVIASRPYMKSIEEVSSEKGLSFTIEVAVEPTVELGDYDSITVKSLKYTAKEKDVKEELVKVQNQNARLISSQTSSKKGDTVMIDFEGFIDGVAFEGGKAEGYSLELGSNSFIDSFETQLIDKNAGDNVEVTVTFPQGYQAPQLAGKEAVFKVFIHDVKTKELPEINDEFAQEVSEFDTLDEFKKDIKASIKAKKETELKNAAQNKVIETAIENSTVVISEYMINERAEMYKKDFENRLKSSGIDPQQYLSGESEEVKAIFDKIQQDAQDRIKGEMVVSKMLEKENITISEEDYENEIKKYADMYKIEPEEFKKRMNPERLEAIRDEARTNKLLEKIMDYVKVEKTTKSKKTTASSPQKKEKESTDKNTTDKETQDNK